MEEEVGLGYKFRPFQALLFKRMKRFNVVVCHRRFGKCFTSETRVPTPDGFKRIVDLHEGDYVIGSDGRPTQILEEYSGGTKQIYEVHFDNGQVAETDDDHVWYVEPLFSKVGVRGNRAPWKCGVYKTTKELLESNERWFIPTSVTEYSDKEVMIEPWFLGYWLGNGSKDSPTITASYEDDHLFNGYTSKQDYNAGCFRYYFSSMTKSFNNYSLFHNKHIPEIYLLGSVEQRIQLLRGLMDSDGTVSASGTCRFDNKNERLIDDFCKLTASLGLIPSKSFYNRNGEKEYYVLFSAKRFLPFTLERKNKKVRFNDRPLRHKISHIVRTNRLEPVYCFQVDAPDNLFLVSDTYIPTHNTIFCLLYILIKAFTCKHKNPQYAYIAPTYGQAERIAWAYLKEMLSKIPNVTINESKLRVKIARPCGDFVTIYLLGAENPDSIRGVYLDGSVLDEYAQCSPIIWGEVIRPALSDRKGWAVFIGTPKGQNNFYEMYQRAQRLQAESPELGWNTFLAKASVTKIIPDDELMAMKSEMSDEEYEQEMECSFTAAMVGSYYGKYLNRLTANGHITTIPYDKSMTVTTFWDLGWDDATAIWFMQRHGQGFRFIKYISNSNVGLEWYAKRLIELGYVYEEHWLPHDGAVKELGTGVSRLETLKEFGLNNIKIAPKLNVEDGINACRMVLDKCWFDAIGTQGGLDCLKAYERKWDAKNNIFSSSPLHNWASNGADAFRTFGVVNRRIANRTNIHKMLSIQNNLEQEKWW